MNVQIMTDTTTDLTPQAASRVRRVNMVLRFGDTEYVDGVDITTREFYERLEKSDVLPTTSQPTPYAFAQAYREALETADCVVCITISAKLSGTYQSASIAADNFPGKVFVVDGRSVTIGTALLVEEALRLADSGLDGETIAEEIAQLRDRVRLFATVDTLEYLKKGGRVSPAVAFAGGLLNIKPIIAVEDGEVKVVGKARGAKQSSAQLTKLIGEAGGVDFTKPLLLGYTGLDDALLRQYIAENTALWAPYGKEPPYTVVGSVVGTHAGPGAVAVAFFTEN